MLLLVFFFFMLIAKLGCFGKIPEVSYTPDVSNPIQWGDRGISRAGGAITGPIPLWLPVGGAHSDITVLHNRKLCLMALGEKAYWGVEISDIYCHSLLWQLLQRVYRGTSSEFCYEAPWFLVTSLQDRINFFNFPCTWLVICVNIFSPHMLVHRTPSMYISCGQKSDAFVRWLLSNDNNHQLEEPAISVPSCFTVNFFVRRGSLLWIHLIFVLLIAFLGYVFFFSMPFFANCLLTQMFFSLIFN